jgi:hypothetical protein
MKCSICKNEGHSATTCDGDQITELTEQIRALWILGHNNSAENDTAIKHWVQNQRFKMTLVNRLWRKLHQIHSDKGWWQITMANRERYAETRFYSPEPKTVEEFRHRILNYVRPAEPEIDMVRIMAEQNEEREVARREERRLRDQRDQERQVRLLAQRERDAANPNLIVQRNIQRHFEEQQRQFQANQRQANYNNEQVVRAHNQAMREWVPTKPPSISAQMDSLETTYFINENCPICLETQTPDNTIALGCKHTCCVSCLKQAMKPGVKHFCVICRKTITQIRFKSNITPENFNIISSHVHTLG